MAWIGTKSGTCEYVVVKNFAYERGSAYLCSEKFK